MTDSVEKTMVSHLKNLETADVYVDGATLVVETSDTIYKILSWTFDTERSPRVESELNMAPLEDPSSRPAILK